MKRTPLFVLFWLAGCGPTWPNAETDGADAGTDTSTGSSSGATTSLTTIGEPPPDGPCRECRLAVPIEFSTTLRATTDNTRLSGATAQGVIVWAVDVVGPGRVAYSADSQMLGQEADDCGFWEWLGGRTAPRVLGTGFFHCAEQDWNALGALENFTYECFGSAGSGQAPGLV